MVDNNLPVLMSSGNQVAVVSSGINSRTFIQFGTSENYGAEFSVQDVLVNVPTRWTGKNGLR